MTRVQAGWLIALCITILLSIWSQALVKWLDPQRELVRSVQGEVRLLALQVVKDSAYDRGQRRACELKVHDLETQLGRLEWRLQQHTEDHP